MIEHAMEVAREAVAAGSAALLEWYGRGVTATLKPDRTPVTEADRAAEDAIVATIRAAFPRHAILAEESGASGPAGAPRWTVDPLDGTRGFARGGIMWGPLVALEQDGRVLAGAMALPAWGLAYWAGRGLGAWRSSGGAEPVRLRVSGVADWSEATLSLGEINALLRSAWKDGVVRLAASAAQARCYGDLAGCALVLDGRAEAWIECGVQAWDLGPLPVLVDEAGGRFTNLDGGPGIAAGHALATNGLLHDRLLAELRPGAG